MQEQQDEEPVKCPRFGFEFTGRCPNTACLLWHFPSEIKCTGCLQLDRGVQNGLQYTEANNSKLLSRLAMSDDPQVQLEASQSLLRFGLVLALQLSEFETLDFELCECGARKASCQRGPVCKKRQEWFAWLAQLLRPIVNISHSIRRRELYHVFIFTILAHHKTHSLPALIEQSLPVLSLSKRIL